MHLLRVLLAATVCGIEYARARPLPNTNKLTPKQSKTTSTTTTTKEPVRAAAAGSTSKTASTNKASPTKPSAAAATNSSKAASSAAKANDASAFPAKTAGTVAAAAAAPQKSLAKSASSFSSSVKRVSTKSTSTTTTTTTTAAGLIDHSAKNAAKSSRCTNVGKTITGISGSCMVRGTQMPVGSCLDNGILYLLMQADGNLVAYESNGTPIWNTDTSGKTGTYHFDYESSGNFNLYKDSSVVLPGDSWALTTAGKTADSLCLMKYGDFSLYSGTTLAVTIVNAGNLPSR